MDEFIAEFIVECTENLSRIDQDLVQLEKNPNDLEVLKNIFRAIHTVKGTCGMFGLQRLERIAHAAEDVLGKMRDGKLAVTPASVGPVLVAVDIIKMILEGLEKTKTEIPGDDSVVIKTLLALLAEDNSSQPSEAASLSANQTMTPSAELAVGVDVSNTAQLSPSVVQDENPDVPSADMADSTKPKAHLSEQSLRVSIDVLEHLMNLVGELVLTRNQLVQLVRGDDESIFLKPIQQFNRVTTGLQEAVMKTRMQPIGNSWSKLPRIVRDLAQHSGKKLELVMKGKETEIDRQILQAIGDPLVHCVRNSADHGIETPDVRIAKGKSPTGTITLNAYREGGNIIIEVADDGAGISVDAVKKKAIEKGLLTAEDSNDLTEGQVLNLIFEPGFSTAQKVTEISGRGVGMDVVRSNIQQIGGSVELISVVGKGTIVKIKIPLTLAIVSALVVKTGGVDGAVFAIPQAGVVELVLISESQQHLIEQIHGAQVLRLRDRLLPLVKLSEILGITNASTADAHVVVVQVGDFQFGLVVEEIYDTQEIVVKPVGRILREINFFAGSTILGDGRVILILDTARISESVLNHMPEPRNALAIESDGGVFIGGDKTSLLLFGVEGEAPMAVPLALVSRLEEFPVKSIEKVGSKHMVQYRGALLPLVFCKDRVNLESFGDRAVPALIFSDGKRSMGLLVSEIVDVVEENLLVENSENKDGVLGAAIISGRATEVIDTYYYLKKAYPDWFDKKRQEKRTKGNRILFAEDSAFFRNLIRPVLETRGFEVTMVEDGAEAFKQLEAGKEFDLVLSDIEMPNMDGWTLAKNTRANHKWDNMPMIALTTLSKKADRDRGLAVGFNEYLNKFEQDVVFAAIERCLANVANS